MSDNASDLNGPQDGLGKTDPDSERVVVPGGRIGEGASRLNALLRAIRNVNQLVARERNRDRLLPGICSELCEASGYQGTWILLLDDTGMQTATAEAGPGEALQTCVARIKRGWPNHHMPRHCHRERRSSSRI